MGELNQLIAFLIRETGWSLEYIRSLPFDDFVSLISEFQFQQACDNYREAMNHAMVISNWASAQGRRRYSITDFIGEPPKREPMKNKSLAKPINLETIILADGKEYKLEPLDLNMLCIIEEKAGLSPFKVLGDGKLSTARLVLYLRLHGNYPELIEEEVGHLVTMDILIKASGVIQK